MKIKKVYIARCFEEYQSIYNSLILEGFKQVHVLKEGDVILKKRNSYVAICAFWIKD